jgi:hypothetical protein
VWIGVLGVIVFAGAGAGLAIGLSGGSSGDKTASGPPSHAPVTSAPVTPSAAAQASPAYTALLQRLPVGVPPGCTDTTAQIAAEEKASVQTQASCTHTLPEARLSITYRAVRGTADEVTAFRRHVLGLGGSNNGPGDCRTLQSTPGGPLGKNGFAQTYAEGSFHGWVWCNRGNTDATMWYLQTAPAKGLQPILTEVRTTLPGGATTGQLRVNDLMIVAPLR